MGEDKCSSSFIKCVPQKQVNKQIHKRDMAYEENIPRCKVWRKHGQRGSQ